MTVPATHDPHLDARADARGRLNPRRGPSGGVSLTLAAAVLIGGLMLLTAIRAPGVPTAGPGGHRAAHPASTGAAAASPIARAADEGTVADYLLTAPVPAPALELTDHDGKPFVLATLRDAPTFVFFGYTHCSDVCPTTVGTVGQAMEASGATTHALFVTIDPERDTPASLHEYVRYLQTGFTAVTGSTDRVAAVAAAWGVRYAKVDTGTPGEYSMSHTADVMLTDRGGLLRARFPFGTTADAMTATLRTITAGTRSTSASPNALAASPAVPAAGLDITVGSSSIWAGPAGPIILNLAAGGTRIDDPALVATVQLAGIDGSPAGPAVPAIAVRPPGETRVLYVASPAIPTPGRWRLTVSATRGGITLSGSADVAVLDPGATAPLGGPAPVARTPTLDDVAGVAKAVTTDPAPDLRLSRTSSVDALAAHQPFVLVVDSAKFKVTSACGRALVMARYLIDRWPTVAFLHLEPLRYDVVTDTPVLVGSLADPTLTDAAAAWGLAGSPWAPRPCPGSSSSTATGSSGPRPRA